MNVLLIPVPLPGILPSSRNQKDRSNVITQKGVSEGIKLTLVVWKSKGFVYIKLELSNKSTLMISSSVMTWVKVEMVINPFLALFGKAGNDCKLPSAFSSSIRSFQFRENSVSKWK